MHANPASPASDAPRPPTGPGGAQAALECPHCLQWDHAAGDTYCSFCGHLLLQLTVGPDPFILISGLAPEKELVLRNASPEPVQAVLVPAESHGVPAVLAFEPAGTLDVPAGGEIRVKIRIEGNQLPLGWKENALRYVCVVNNDDRKALPVVITVRSGPRPHLLTPTLQFGDLREGTDATRLLELSNAGGTPFQVLAIRPIGSSQLLLAAEPSFPLRLNPGERMALPVVWDARMVEKEMSTSQVGFRIDLGKPCEPLFVPARARVFQFRLELDPPSLNLGIALSRQDHVRRVTIRNAGTIGVEISRVESDQPWIEIVSSQQSFSLESGDGSDAPPAGAVAQLDVVCHPQTLKPGRYTGKVAVWPTGHEKKTLDVEMVVVQPEEYTEYIGIDFGTTNSVIALIDQASNEIKLVEDGPAKGPVSPLIPSVLVFSNGPETYTIGSEARNAADVLPELTVRSIKRVMGYDRERTFFDRVFTPEDLAALILKRLVELAERKLLQDTKRHHCVRKAIVTVPANFFDRQIRGILEACSLAGVDTEEELVRQAAESMRENLQAAVNAGIILDEPSAAVLYYLYFLEQLDRGQGSETPGLLQEIGGEGGLNLLVFDYGGGTLDVSIANVKRLPEGAVGLRILANMGNNRIGGDTIDLTIMRELLERCRFQVHDFDTALIESNFADLEARRLAEGWDDGTWRGVLRVRSRWKDLAETAKIDLSTSDSALCEVSPDLVIHLQAGRLRTATESCLLELRATEMEKLIGWMLDDCTSLIESALDLAEIVPGDVHYVLHTGRQSLMPAIRKRVQTLFPGLSGNRDILDEEHLKVCVAKGAALYGLMRGKIQDPSSGVHFLNEGRRLPHAYGVDKVVGLMQREFDEIIARGSSYPTDEVREFDQRMIPPSGWLNLKFYQNLGNRRMIDRNPDIRLIGQTTVNALANGKRHCTVRFLIDANRKLEVFANGKPVKIDPVRIHAEESWMG